MAEMKIFIYSRKAMEKLLKSDFPENVAIISFYDPPGSFRDADYQPVDYSTKTDCVFEVALHDIDFAVLPKYHLTYETYFPEAVMLLVPAPARAMASRLLGRATSCRSALRTRMPCASSASLLISNWLAGSFASPTGEMAFMVLMVYIMADNPL